MEFLIWFSFLIFYIALSGTLIVITNKRYEKARLTVIAIILAIVFSAWDVLFGALIYFPSCLFFPKVAIYETAYTDGLLYEGLSPQYVAMVERTGRNPGRPVLWAILRGFKFAEDVGSNLYY